MKQALCRFIYYKVLGWKAHVSIPNFDKCVFCAAPHTTNWDLFIGKLFISAIGRESGFMMKKEWFFFPLGILFRWMGGSPNPNWKRGFYYIAQGAEIPIVLVGIDYEKKCIRAEKYLYASGDIERDMREIKLYFKPFKGKHPERFDLGENV